MKNFLTFCFALGLWSVAIGQDTPQSTDYGTLLFISGNEIHVLDFDDTTASDLKYLYDKNQFRRRKIRLRHARKTKDWFAAAEPAEAAKVPVDLRRGAVDRREVFSYVGPEGDKRVYYQPDTAAGRYETVAQMEAYAIGGRDARLTLTGRGWFWLGLGTGAAAGYFLETSVFSLAVPPLFALAARIPVVRIKPEYISDARYQYNEDYALGFADRARGHNTLQALKGSALGTALGIVAYILVQNNN